MIPGAVCQCHLNNNYDYDKATVARVQFYIKFRLHVAKCNYKEDWQQRAQNCLLHCPGLTPRFCPNIQGKTSIWRGLAFIHQAQSCPKQAQHRLAVGRIEKLLEWVKAKTVPALPAAPALSPDPGLHTPPVPTRPTQGRRSGTRCKTWGRRAALT